MQDIYSEGKLPNKQYRESQNTELDSIIYLDNYTDITLGSLIRETKELISDLPPDYTIILMVTNTYSTISPNVVSAYQEYGYYIQSLIANGVKIGIIFRGIISRACHTSLLEANTDKYISKTTRDTDSPIPLVDNQAFMQQFYLKIL